MATIYLSSTYEDLKDHRTVVFDALRKAGHHVVAMEDYVATDKRPVDKCLTDVKKADMYVGLFAFRYGYVPPVQHNNPHGLSITELEYRQAEVLKKPCLMFVVNETTAWPRSFDDTRMSEDKGERINTLREHLLTEKLASSFSSKYELSTLVLAAVSKYLEEKNVSKVASPEFEAIRPPDQIHWPAGKSPYPGLLSFGQEYAELFFGRDGEVVKVIEKMSEPDGRFLVISGASGSGKSSLVAAGVWRALMKEGRISGNTNWTWVRIQPSDGDTPLDALSSGLKHAFHSISTRRKDLAHALAAGSMTIRSLFKNHLAPDQELVLFIDQLEELYTQTFDEKHVENFLDLLIRTAQDPDNQLRVISTVRSEFIARLEESESVLRVLNAGYNYHLGPVSLRTLQEMIEYPAHATGYAFDVGLVDAIMGDAAQEPGALPLVAYALHQLFTQRNGQTFSFEAYRSFGGVAGAIGTQADHILAHVHESVQEVFDVVFAELVHLDRDRPPTRRRVALGVFEGNDSANELIRVLSGPDCRILVKSDEKREAIVEVAHEKLFSAWPRLHNWIAQSGEELRLIDYAEEAARRWHEMGGHLQELWLSNRTEHIQKALTRFNKHASPMLEQMLRPQPLLIARLEDDRLSHEDRMLIGKKLAEFGDPRPGVGLSDDGLPDIEWVDIPGGQITLLGDVKNTFKVQPFRIARYLVTNKQFEAFIDDGSYENNTWWQGIQRPDAEPSSRQESNAPRETVSWYEAVAFCRWLSHRTGSLIRLPTEWEWQQAATEGNHMRKYPWGEEWDARRCNSSESRLNRTTAVGLYTSGATQPGVLDMAGNVCEWCLNKDENPHVSEALIIDGSVIKRAIRGGSWYHNPYDQRTSLRTWYSAGSRNDFIGFRLVQDVP